MRKGRKVKSVVVRRTARRRSRSAGAGVSLSREERHVLREACMRYQHDLPTYLETARSEMNLLEKILRKL